MTICASYGDLAEAPQQFWGGFAQMLSSDDAPDPQRVADAILDLISTPAGQRPLRIVVDPMSGGEGPTAINQMTDQIQAQMFSAMGIGEMVA